jgi:ferredoxin-type protein NapG
MARRRFFRRGLAELLKPMAKAIRPLERAANEIGNLEAMVASSAAPTAAPRKPAAPAPVNNLPPELWLRPPGAIAEKLFKQTCTRGGECVKACPAQCIKIDPTGGKGEGAPYIDVDAMPCVVCDGLYCMHVCPSGALVPTSINDIDMGTAVWNQSSCLRSFGQECTICVDNCPLGTAAIELKDNEIVVNPHGCIGCAVCHHDCPTTPKSIYVIPKMAKER